MEEAVTKKFIYEESNCILALCSKYSILFAKKVIGLIKLFNVFVKD